MILVSMAIILFSSIVSWLEEIFSRTIGIAWGLATAVLAVYCRSRATGEIKTNRKYYLWLLLPMFLTVIAIGYRLWTIFKPEETSWLMRIWEITPIFVSFFIPMALLWIAYSALESHMPRVDSDAAAEQSGTRLNSGESQQIGIDDK